MEKNIKQLYELKDKIEDPVLKNMAGNMLRQSVKVIENKRNREEERKGLSREKIIGNVRQESNGGWFVGGMVFYKDNAECWDKDSGYYPTEEILKGDYPNSVSVEEAFKKARRYGWTE